MDQIQDVRVYQLSRSFQVKMGSDIDGGASSDYFGWSVDINNTGSRIVVGAIYDDNGGLLQVQPLFMIGMAVRGRCGLTNQWVRQFRLPWMVSFYKQYRNKIIAGIPYEDELPQYED